jgi:Glutathione S-transferase, N-terminal domain
MKLYVCYGTFTAAPRPGGHPCGNAYHALRDAGHEPEVIRSYGLGIFPGIFNRTRGRQEVKQLTGSYMVPVLVTDDGEVITESRRIMEWARAHPAGADRGGATPSGAGPRPPESPSP